MHQPISEVWAQPFSIILTKQKLSHATIKTASRRSHGLPAILCLFWPQQQLSRLPHHQPIKQGPSTKPSTLHPWFVCRTYRQHITSSLYTAQCAACRSTNRTSAYQSPGLARLPHPLKSEWCTRLQSQASSHAQERQEASHTLEKQGAAQHITACHSPANQPHQPCQTHNPELAWLLPALVEK